MPESVGRRRTGERKGRRISLASRWHLGGLWAIVVILGLLVGACSEVKRYDLVAIADTTMQRGSWTLLGGMFEGKLMYQFYYRTDKGVVGGQWTAECAAVVEVEDVKPYVTMLWDGANVKWQIDDCRGKPPARFYVPPNTVKQQFALDLR